VRLPPVKTSATVPQKLPALKRKYPNGAWKPLKPLANCCLCRLSCFTLKSLAYERLQQRIHTCRLQYPTTLSMANGGIGFVAQAEVAEATPGWSAAEKSVPGAVRHSHRGSRTASPASSAPSTASGPPLQAFRAECITSMVPLCD
jgi:hypothetical protein